MSRPRALAVATCAIASALACGGTLIAPPGAKGGACLPDATCNPGLTCLSGVCVRLRTDPPTMVKLPQGYSITSTEVTRDQYAAWLGAFPDPAKQSKWKCTWNHTYTPDPACSKLMFCQSGDCGKHPQACVDWCDAYAYCRDLGLRLCGRIGAHEAVAFDDFANAAESQWHNACVSGDRNHAYPYGSTFAPEACRGNVMINPAAVEVGTMPECQSSEPGYSAVYDLSGNVWEWEDSCDVDNGATDLCHLRGGSFSSTEPTLRCDHPAVVDRHTASPDVGFRCCWSP